MKATPCLPVMHEKAHSWHCQVRIHTVTFYLVIIVSGVEDVLAKLFSYLLQFNNTTKCMNSSGMLVSVYYYTIICIHMYHMQNFSILITTSLKLFCFGISKSCVDFHCLQEVTIYMYIWCMYVHM